MLEQAARHVEELRELTEGFERAHRTMDADYKKLIAALEKKVLACQKLVGKLKAELSARG